MHTEVSYETVLKALAAFLTEQIRPNIKDAKLSFQLLIAESLLAGLALERKGEHTALGQEHARLVALLAADATTASGTDTRAAIAQMTERVLAEVPTASTERLAQIRAHVVATLREDIVANNPRFSLAEEI
jgi:hypothetical protein